MTDRELLEAAARAAGYRIKFIASGDPYIQAGINTRAWNPLIYDGDRYRLLKALNMGIDFEANEVIYIVDGNLCGNRSEKTATTPAQSSEPPPR